MTTPAELHELILDKAGSVLIGNEDVLEQILIATLVRGHILLEGPPGVAKTTIARLFANLADLEYSRIQMMPDLLPSDITGTHIYHQSSQTFELRRGPVFANIVLADEINRATPKTQSALLEAMEERIVTIGEETVALPTPFLLIATQNPIDTEGTYRLPLAQRDRFQFKLSVDLPSRVEERELMDLFDAEPNVAAENVDPVVTASLIESAQRTVSDVYVDEKIKEYVLDIVEATREHPAVEHGVSPRATLAFLNGGKARAAINSRDYVIPSDIKSLSDAILTHRLVLEKDTEFSGRNAADVTREIVGDVETPESQLEADAPHAEQTVSDGGNASSPNE